VALHLHRAPRTDLLAEALGDLLATPLDDPLVQEVVVVPARGVERWLTQRLSHRLGVGDGGDGADDGVDEGVCAGVRFLQPRSLVSLLIGRDTGDKEGDPWDPDRLVWPLLATIDASLGEPWCATLAAHLGHGRTGPDAELRRNRRYSVAIRLASLFASYAVQRPTLVTDWREGRDTDGAGGDLDADLRWQPELWRRLLPRVAGSAPDERHAATLAALRAGGDGLDLPPRLSLFGHTRLPASEVELLGALGECRDVHLYLPQASPALWDALGGRAGGSGGVVARDDDDSATLVGHPLLASLGRDARELRRTLDGAGFPSGDAVLPSGRPGRQDTLLGLLQHDLRANHAPTIEERAGRRHEESDRSLQVHACHGPSRQVDVLREVLVGLLEDDPTLEPRDILVMCPDIETFAPLISAGFGLAPTGPEAAEVVAGHPAHRLRVKLADRALVSTNPLLAVAGVLLELSGGRVTASEVLDLASAEPCRRRFAFTDDDLERAGRWVARTGVRWGLDQDTRASFAMDKFPQNTWRTGLDRILLGVAMSGDDHHHLGTGLPLDDVGSNEVDLAGRLAELVDRLDLCLTALGDARSVGDWMEALRTGVRDLTDVSADDAWQLPQLERELARAAASDQGGGELELRLADVRAMLAGRLAGRPTRANFRTGTLTVCTMVPMRSVPHRVVCLLGLDDGVFPRSGFVDGDDVLARRPRTGERDGRSEDRQLMLDAVMAATEHLVITYTGANEHSGARRPPAVPLGELLDAADRTTAAAVRDAILTRHPLQPHDPRNLKAGDPATDPPEWSVPELRGPSQRPFSFDGAALAGARAASGVRRPVPPLLTGDLPVRAGDDVTLADLVAFLMHPVRTFLRGRLDVSTPFEPDDLGDSIPVSLDSLEVWQVGDRLLGELLKGQDPVAVMTAEQLRGTLPPYRLGERALTGVTEECQKLWKGTAELRTGTRRSVDVDVDLGDGRRLTGTVPGVYGTRLVSLGYSRLKAKQRLRTWVELLALSASDPDQAWTGHAVGRERAGPKRALTGPLDERALGWLRSLVELRDVGLTKPLPIPIATAAAWAEAHARAERGMDIDVKQALRREWETDRFSGPASFSKEDEDAYHVRVFGLRATVEDLLEAGLATYAWQVWEPLLSGVEKVGPL
jgi:exodeoxyribonuclease V gamma subunit